MTGDGQVSLLICDDHKVLTDALSTVIGLDATSVWSAHRCTPPKKGSPSRSNSSPTSC